MILRLPAPRHGKSFFAPPRRRGLARSEALAVLARRDIHEDEMEELVVGLIVVQIEFQMLYEPRLLSLVTMEALKWRLERSGK